MTIHPDFAHALATADQAEHAALFGQLAELQQEVDRSGRETLAVQAGAAVPDLLADRPDNADPLAVTLDRARGMNSVITALAELVAGQGDHLTAAVLAAPSSAGWLADGCERCKAGRLGDAFAAQIRAVLAEVAEQVDVEFPDHVPEDWR